MNTSSCKIIIKILIYKDKIKQSKLNKKPIQQQVYSLAVFLRSKSSKEVLFMAERNFNYYHGKESEQFSFFRIPKVLYTDPIFKNLSSDAKVLYGILLDRVKLSGKNGWVDENNRVFIYFTIQSIMEIMGWGNKKSVKVLSELDTEKGIGLIEKQRQGQGKPTKIYVKNFIVDNLSEVSKRHFKKCRKYISRSVKRTR